MAGNQVITVKEADGVTLTDVEVLGTGRQAVAASKSVGWANEDQAAIGIVTETAPAGDTASSGLNGRLQRIAQRISSLIGLFPNALGASGGMKVEIVAGAGSGGTAIADGGTFTANTTSGTPTGGFYQTTVTANPLSTGKFGWSQMTPFRANHVNLRDALGNDLVSAASAGAPAASVPAIVVTNRDVNPNINAVTGVATTAGTPTVNFDPYSQYETVAASASAQVMGATGAQYDYLAGVLVIPGAAAAGAVSITDGNGSAIQIFAGGGTVALPSLVPFMVPLGLYALASTTPGWKITTGTSVTAIGIGKFT